MKRDWIIAGLTVTGLMLAAGAVISGHHEREHESDEHGWGWGRARHDINPVQHAKYAEECGACHFAYQPGLLPTASWQRIMAGLSDHFGENAELDATTRTELLGYLTDNAADQANGGRSAHITVSLQDTTPLRITETAYFRRKHHEIPLRAVKDNPKVGSFSQCNTCHTTASQGSYDEDSVRIPGWGRWED